MLNQQKINFNRIDEILTHYKISSLDDINNKQELLLRELGLPHEGTRSLEVVNRLLQLQERSGITLLPAIIHDGYLPEVINMTKNGQPSVYLNSSIVGDMNVALNAFKCLEKHFEDNRIASFDQLTANDKFLTAITQRENLKDIKSYLAALEDISKDKFFKYPLPRINLPKIIRHELPVFPDGKTLGQILSGINAPKS